MKTVIAFAIMITLISCGKSSNSNSPERPANVPENAKWVGGPDGGNWFEFVSMSGDSIFHIKVYNDHTGELEAEGPFVLNSDCNVKRLDASGVFQNIGGYDGNVILLNMIVNGKNCVLISQPR